MNKRSSSSSTSKLELTAENEDENEDGDEDGDEDGVEDKVDDEVAVAGVQILRSVFLLNKIHESA